MNVLPDIDVGCRFLARCPPPGRVLCCAVTGSHQYGFPSPDSDLDLKGIHLAPTEALLGLDGPIETHDRLELFEGAPCDLTTHEAAKAMGLLLRGNGNMLERIRSPFQLAETAELPELRRLSEGALSRRFFAHYRGFFKGICNEHEKSGARHGKTLLYAYRVALTGVHLLRTGDVITNLTELADRYGFPEALDLVERKRATAEKMILSKDDDELHRSSWPRLEAALESARAESLLPEGPSNRTECSAWLTALRRRELTG